MTRKASIIITIIGWLLLNQVFAVPLNHLYENKVAVQERTANERRSAVRQALKKVLVKVSGNKSITTLPLIRNKLDDAENYLQGYTYQANPTGGFWLVLNFSESAIRELLHNCGQAIWGKERPQVITWLVMMQKPQAQLIYADSETQVPKLLYQAANFRGVPIILPLADTSLLTDVKVDDVVNHHIDKLHAASKRYTAPALLLAEINPSIDGPWEAKWVLVVDGETLNFSNQGQSLAHVIQEGVGNVAELLASRYAILNSSGNQTTVAVSVTDIKSVSDYARVADYLRSLPPVKDVEMQDVSPDHIVYALELNGDVHTLIQAMALNPILVPHNNKHNIADVGEILHYRLHTT